MDEQLKKALERAAFMEYLKAEMYVTKQTVQSRVLEKAKTLLGINNCSSNMNRTNDDLMYIHPEISAFLNIHFPADHSSFDEGESHLARTIYSNDRHDPETLRAFCNLLERKVTSDTKHHVFRVFAVDGFRGDTLFDYVDHLRYPLSGCHGDWRLPEKTQALQKHVKAVRELYEKFAESPVETVALVLKNAMNYVESSDAVLRKMTNFYLSQTISNLDDIQLHFETLKDRFRGDEIMIE